MKETKKTEWVSLRRAVDAPAPLVRPEEEPLHAPLRKRSVGPRKGANTSFAPFQANPRTQVYRRARRAERVRTLLLGGCLLVASIGAATVLAAGIVWVMT